MKKFGKAPAAPTPPVEEVEVEVDEAVTGEAEEGEGEEKVKGAPRARKWNYGITAEGIISRVAGVESGPKGCAEAFEATAKPITVEKFSETVDDWRHCLRVMMRGKYVVIKNGGETYPQEYDHAAAAAAREAKAAAKAAKEAEADEETEAEEAPAPAKKRSAKK
jgi:hypothetical protein